MATSLQLRRRRMLRCDAPGTAEACVGRDLRVGYGLHVDHSLYWMVVTAFQQPTLSVTFPPKWFPSPPTMRNFSAVCTFAPVSMDTE